MSSHEEAHSLSESTALGEPVGEQTFDNGVSMVTFGCRLNVYESEVMKNLSQAAGLSKAIIVNTCAVTAEAERQARQSIRKMRRLNPDAKIIITGCSAQIHPEHYSEMEEVDAVIGNDDKMRLETYTKLAEGSHAKVLVNDIMSVKETASHLISGFEGKTRAFVQVQNGCNHRCTFCIIPYGRGNSRSVPIGEVVTQVRTLVEAGYSEIVFTGVDITSYGEDLPGAPSLGQMMRRTLALVPELKRLRLSSVDSVEMDEDLWYLIEREPRLMPHLHLSLQAGDDMILKRMKRRHSRADAIALCKKAKTLRPDIVFGADLIAGFPTETNEMFENTLKIVDECGLTYLHVFPYSARPGTPASRMPKVASDVVKERALRLRQKSKEVQKVFFDSFVGQTVRVLVESVDDESIKGKTDHFVPVVIPSCKIKSSDLSVIYVNIEVNCTTYLKGTLV